MVLYNFFPQLMNNPSSEKPDPANHEKNPTTFLNIMGKIFFSDYHHSLVIIGSSLVQVAQEQAERLSL